MKQMSLYEYVMAYKKDAPIPPEVMTMGGLAELLERIKSVTEPILHPVDEAQQIEREMDEFTAEDEAERRDLANWARGA